MTTRGPVEGGLDEPEELEPEQGSLALADPADTHTRADWEAAAAAVLRRTGTLGEDDADELVWQRLGRTTLDGIVVPPLGTRDHLDGLVTSGRPGRVGDWDVRTRPADNAQALADLANGATSLWLPEGADLPTLLAGVRLDAAPVVLGSPSAEAVAVLVSLLDGAPAADGTNLGAGPRDPALPGLLEQARGAGVLAVVVDGTRVHEQGASDVQELGHVLAEAAAYLRTATAAGLEVAEAARLVEFRLAVTGEQFPGIAKLRAVRRLWARMLELSGAAEAVPMRVHAVTSRPMLGRHDPYVNMLRATVAAFAAGVGGADAVTVVPFDSPLGDPGELGRRIARNTSSLLMAESHLGRVADPAGGAYAVERLTDDVAVAAWAELGRIEADGAAAFAARVADVAARRDEEVATRRRPLTGISEFPDPAATPPARSGPGDGVRRWGAAFEELRDDPAARPVFLATMGPVAAHTARAGFAANLFVAGGVTVQPAGATSGVEQVLAAYDGQPVACLAGTDAAYSDWGAELVSALRGAGAARVVVAGSPDVAAAVGADDRCHVGMDAVAFLRRTREELR